MGRKEKPVSSQTEKYSDVIPWLDRGKRHMWQAHSIDHIHVPRPDRGKMHTWQAHSIGHFYVLSHNRKLFTSPQTTRVPDATLAPLCLW